jgi:glycerol-1-phosphate dehydrogenase [NAD(P)+]
MAASRYQEAPYQLATAGLGDILAKSISTTNWYMNHLLFEDHYYSRSAGLIGEIEPLYLDCSEDLKEGKPGAMEALFHALLLTGVSMNMAETSSPASGAEHLISHSLDMLDAINGKREDLHGRQVGLGTVMMAALYQMVLKTDSPNFMEPRKTADTSFWGPLGDVVQENFSGKADRLHLAGENLKKGDAWDQSRKQLSSMPHRDPSTVSLSCQGSRPRRGYRL